MNFSSTPFKHDSEVTELIPDIFKNDGVTCYEWFNKPPKFTTFRVNTLVTTSENVVQLIQKQLSEQALSRGVGSIPSVHVHGVLPDCVIVGSWETGGNPQAILEDSAAEVIVDVLCACAILRGAHAFAPGIMGMPHGAKEGSIVRVFADLNGKCRRGFVQTFNGDKLFVGIGVVKMDRHKLFDNNAQPRGVAIQMLETESHIPNFTLPSEFGILQNLPSIVCSYALDLNHDHTVLDMCAAPGNKTTHIATLMRNEGTIIALDKSKEKVEKIKAQCQSLGIKNIKAFVWDSTQSISHEKSGSEELPPMCEEYFDRILLDAPCSALGNRPQLRNNITAKQLKSYSVLQKKLFENAVKLLKTGGILVYSTCTITLEENEKLVIWALEKFPELALCKPDHVLGSCGLPQGNLTFAERECLQRFGLIFGDKPEEDTIGFFISKFRKISLC